MELSPEVRNKYTVVIGLEVHAQLLTNSKAFSPDVNSYGDEPNINISPITLAHPGVLPKVNKSIIEKAIKMGIACNSKISRYNIFDRKNYFYPDLPKGYQITQDKTPICIGGQVNIELPDGTKRAINLTRIHCEEDAGKSMHLAGEIETLVDYNRAGVPLIEIVSAPDLRTTAEVQAYLNQIRRLVRYLDVCDGNMEEGSLRCDANISVMLNDAKQYGNRVEIKNMNSIRNVMRAIDYETIRQISVLEDGGTVMQETRMFDVDTGVSHGLRAKENLTDYRYFPEPDLPPIIVTDQWLEQILADMPDLPEQLYIKFTNQFGLSDYDAKILIDEKPIAQYYSELIKLTQNYKQAANWLIGPIKGYLNERAITIEKFALSPAKIVEIIELIESGKISHSAANQRLFPEMLKNPDARANDLAKQLNILQEKDEDALLGQIKKALEANPAKVAEYRKGKKGLFGMFMGEVMKATQGKADPVITKRLLEELLDNQ